MASEKFKINSPNQPVMGPGNTGKTDPMIPTIIKRKPRSSKSKSKIKIFPKDIKNVNRLII